MATGGSSTAEGSWTGHDEFQQNIRKAYAKLTTSLTKFEVTSITAKLFSHSIILPGEFEHIQGISIDIDSAQALCNIILKKDKFACKMFVKALHEIRRDNLVDLIWKKAITPDKQRFFDKLDKLKTELDEREQQQQADRTRFDIDLENPKKRKKELQERETIRKRQQAKWQKLIVGFFFSIFISITYAALYHSDQAENFEKQKKELQEHGATLQFTAEIKLRSPVHHALPVQCHDLAVTADGHLLLAAWEHGMQEYDESGRQLSSWTPAKTAKDSVFTVDELQDGRVAVGLFHAKTVLLLRRSAAARDSWQQQQVFQLQGTPVRLSVHAQLMASLPSASV